MEINKQKDGDPSADPSAEQANKLFQTGVILLSGKKKSIDKAIKCIQRAITFNESDYKFWQLLGEAYYQRGSLNPAINCFLKSLELAKNLKPGSDDTRRKADCIYSELRMSDIQLSVGQLNEATTGYLDIISSDPKNVAALIGYSRTELQMARNDFANGLVLSGHSHCMKALQHSFKAIKLCPHLCITWKLASDCCLEQFIHGQRGQFEDCIYEKLVDDDENDFIVINRFTIIEMSKQFLCKALTIEPFGNSGCLWHNLGISLYLKSTLIEQEEERVQTLRRSMKCLLKALDSDRDSSQLKNSIGVVAFHLNLLNTAQNYLVKSIRSNRSTSEIQFSNLGYIYTQKGAYRLASAAFNRCQAEEPLYARSWLGNAIISDQKNEDNYSHLRHCHILDNSLEPQLLFATKVTSLPINRGTRKDLINALDSMRRAINYLPLSTEACNTLGLLYERSGYRQQAKFCFDRAYRSSKNDSRVIFNKLRQHRASSSCCPDRITGSQPDAEFINAAEELAASSSNKGYILNFIYYLFNNGDYRNVTHIFEASGLLDKIPRDDIQSRLGAQILLGLSSRGDNNDYKSWFFKNLVDSEKLVCIESLINLICLLIFGTLSNDEQLTEQISNDLSRYLTTFLTTRKEKLSDLLYEVEGQWIRLAIFTSIFCLKDQGKLIRSVLAMHPTIAELWLYLGLALMFDKKKYQTAVDCITTASRIGSNCSDLRMVCDVLLAILSQAGRSKQPKKTLDERKIYLSRAIYKYPDYQLLWDALKSESKTRPTKRDHVLSDEKNSSLFNLAIELTIRMVIA